MIEEIINHIKELNENYGLLEIEEIFIFENHIQQSDINFINPLINNCIKYLFRATEKDLFRIKRDEIKCLMRVLYRCSKVRKK